MNVLFSRTNEDFDMAHFYLTKRRVCEDFSKIISYLIDSDC